MYINLPSNVPRKLFTCKIQSKHVEVGIKGNPPYLNHDLTSHVKTDSSFWTIEDDILHITLQKREKGQTWVSPISGQGQLDPYASDLEQKRLMLQRFQEENPGFDFSQAQFSGDVVDSVDLMKWLEMFIALVTLGRIMWDNLDRDVWQNGMSRLRARVIGKLTSSCLLLKGDGDGSDTMHDIVRDVAIIIAKRDKESIVLASW
ncbi:hypothetical protein IFM89_011194 [Coptis chinensis]|uniref:CS domain-containing protein n=1 Tax=Coptis chinensis TaxID=261450 RepID=A0A835LU26_9MAGN|nr:hypothetical protein IFM89_011194 [Coptis chinensis]